MGPGELLILLVVVLLLFMPAKLPALARSVGQAQRELRKGLKEGATKLAPPSRHRTRPAAEPAGDADTKTQGPPDAVSNPEGTDEQPETKRVGH